MSMLIVGSDRIDGLRRALDAKNLGRRIEHWDGRKVGFLRKSLPKDTELVIVIWHHIGHPLLKHVRDEAQRRGVPVLYTRYASGSKADSVARGDDIVELAARWLTDPNGARAHAQNGYRHGHERAACA